MGIQKILEAYPLKEVIENWEKLAWFLALLAFSIIVGIVAYSILLLIIKRIARRTPTILDDAFIRHCRKPVRFLIPLLTLNLFSPLLGLPETLVGPLRHLLSLGIIASIAWLFVQGTYVLNDFILSRYELDEKDNLQARKVYTQLQIFKKIVIFTVGIVSLAIMLMTFERFRQFGATILASAGIIGIVVGLATQRTISTILAGLQIAITQPIRLDDVVIVENEWGRIEEITFTYVVVRIWDLRRLVLPITYFIEKPFQNWTRVTADILGTVFFYVDYTVPVQAIREELHRILKSSNLWNGLTWGLQVTNITERTVELRALMSASDASKAWHLRCMVRESLLDFIQRTYPEGLPKARAEIRNARRDEILPGPSGLASQSPAVEPSGSG
ncbi:MAG: mechanosensitive ion channel family protein [Proteobacteria bacterium]|nr:mechanosensitive ion channel family protein [Pseudomonadota bacterium]